MAFLAAVTHLWAQPEPATGMRHGPAKVGTDFSLSDGIGAASPGSGVREPQPAPVPRVFIRRCGLKPWPAHDSGYTIRLSPASIGVQPEAGHVIAIHFPAAPLTFSSAGLAKYHDVFPGIDLIMYRHNADFEYDWIVGPGADPAAIEVTITGAEWERIGSEGDLISGSPQGFVRHGRPFAYQEVNGQKREVPAQFDLGPDGRVRFKLGAYDRTRTLTIDPALSFVSGLGGKGFLNYFLHPDLLTDFGSAIALDRAGNIYVAGFAYSQDFPLVNPLPLPPLPCAPFHCVCPGAFVAKLSPDARTILYSTLLAFSCSGAVPSLAADADGNVYVAGVTQNGSPFIQTGTATNGKSDAFIVKLDASGALKAALKIGGSADDAATAIALGGDGKLYVTGVTSSQDFPVTPAALKPTLSSSQDLFLMKIDPSLVGGSQLASGAVLYSTYLGPGASPVVAADSSGNAYVAASTNSTAWNTTSGAFQSRCWDAERASCADVIALKIHPAGTAFLYATYIGGSGADTIGGIALDGSGSAYLTGTTSSFDFPVTPGAYQAPGPGASSVAFALKLSADASHLTYSTLLAQAGSANGTMSGSAIAVDTNGNAWIGGSTDMANLPAQDGIQQTLFNSVCSSYTPSGSTPSAQGYCPNAGWLAELNSSGSALVWATYLGGGNVSGAYVGATLPSPSLGGIVFDSLGDVLVTGNQLGMLNTAASPATTNSASVVKIATRGTSLHNVAVANAAGFESGLPAPGGLAALYVTGIPLTGTFLPQGLPLPTELAGVRVSVNGVPCPLLAVAGLPNSSNRVQVNFQVPFELPNAAQPQPYIVEVQFADQSAFIVPQQAGPGIFISFAGAAIQHASDYTLVTAANPARRGEILIIYATGLGAVATPVPSGTGALGADPIAECSRGLTTNAGTVLYAGLTPGIPGLYQVNVQVSQYLPPGTNYIYLQQAGCWFGPAPPQNVYQGNSVGVYIP